MKMAEKGHREIKLEALACLNRQPNLRVQ